MKIFSSIKSLSGDCGGFQKPKGHLDTQMFPECAGTECDRDIVKKTREKRKKKKSFNLKEYKMEKKADFSRPTELSGISKEVVPVEQMIGTVAKGTIDEIDKDMHSKGYFLFREHYHFGRMLSYQNIKGDKIYLLNGKWALWNEVKKDLQETWRPTGEDALKWYWENIAETSKTSKVKACKTCTISNPNVYNRKIKLSQIELPEDNETVDENLDAGLPNGPFYVSIYEVSREFGGPEEGGWWYEAYRYIETKSQFDDQEEAFAYARELNEQFAKSNEDLSSSKGFENLPEGTEDSQIPIGFGGDATNLVAMVENEPGEEDISKKGRPHYE